MTFESSSYEPQVASLLSLDGDGHRLMPLTAGKAGNSEAKTVLKQASSQQLFPHSPHPEAAYAGLWLYFSWPDEAHETAQSIESAEGSFWHGILHRQEPDAGNAAYWFRRVGQHPVFPRLADAALAIGVRFNRPEAFHATDQWDPFAFIDFCERADTQPDSGEAQQAREIQRAEWQILFDYCARPVPQ